MVRLNFILNFILNLIFDSILNLQGLILRHFVLVICLGSGFGSVSVSGSGSAQELSKVLFNRLAWNEIKPSSLANDAMAADMIKGTSLVDHDRGAILMSGKTHVWRWNLLDGAVSRAVSPPDLVGGLTLVAVTKAYIAGIDERGGWIFFRKSKMWKRVDGSFGTACQPKRVSAVPQVDPLQVYILTDCGLYLLLAESLQLVALKHDFFADGSGAESAQMTAMSDGGAFLYNGNQLFKLTFDGPRVHNQLIYRAKSRIRGVIGTGAHYVAWTSQALIFFDKSLVRVQVVPVLGRRKIQSFSADDNNHLVLFTDGAVELMQLSSKLKWAASGYHAVSAVMVPGQRLAILSPEAGIPRVFSMTNVR
jgi:hypothetical protein